jgi:anaerobic selenocysteine-containing dehydrogenase
MGMTEPELFETDEALIADLLTQARPGTSFADLAPVGTMFVSDEVRPQFANLAFATPSGRIEIDAETFLQAGLAAAPAVRADARAPDHALRLISPSHRWLMNSTYGNDAAVRRQMGPDALLLNVADAAIRQLATGHWVEVHSAAASLRLQVEVSDVPPPGVAVCYKSRWLQFDGQQANVNVLNPGLRGDLGDGTAVNSLDITLRPVAAPVS